MTRNWTDYPLTVVIPRKTIHQTELHNAYEERIRFLKKLYPNEASDFPIPTWLYAGGKEWGDDYPKANPEHWPPKESPDNLFRDNHIENLRYVIPGFGSSPDSSEAPSKITYLAPSAYNLPEFCLVPGDSYYRPYHNAASRGSQGFNIFTNIGLGVYATGYTDPTLIAGSTIVKSAHINQVRAVIEECSVFFVKPKYVYVRFKQGFSGSWQSSKAAAISAAATDFDGESWIGWVQAIPLVDDALPSTFPGSPYGFSHSYLDEMFAAPFVMTKLRIKSDGTYYADIMAQEIKLVFDLDLEIYDAVDWPYYILSSATAKLCVGGYGVTQTESPDTSNVYWSDGTSMSGGADAEQIDNTVDFWLRCSTTSSETSDEGQETFDTYAYDGSTYFDAENDYRKSYVIASDVSSYLGSDDQEFLLTIKGDYGDAFDQLVPPGSTPESGTIYSMKTARGIFHNTIGGDDDYGNHAGLYQIAIEPNWRYGRG